MDQMVIKTPLLRKFISNLLVKIVAEKIGVDKQDLELSIHTLSFSHNGDKVVANASLQLDTSSETLSKILDRIGE